MTRVHHVDVPDYPAAHSPYSHATVAKTQQHMDAPIPVHYRLGKG